MTDDSATPRKSRPEPMTKGIHVTTCNGREAIVLIPEGEDTQLKPSFVLVELIRPAMPDEMTSEYLPPVTHEKIIDGGRRLTGLKLTYEGAVALERALRVVLAPFEANRKDVQEFAVEMLREYLDRFLIESGAMSVEE